MVIRKVKRRPTLPPSIMRAKRTIQSYAKRMHQHGLAGITSAHDTRHVHAVAKYGSRLVRFFGGTQKQKALVSISGHLHDRIRVASEQLIPRKEAIAILTREFAKESQKMPQKQISELVNEAFSERKRMLARGQIITDYAPRTQGQGLTSDELTAVFLKKKLQKSLGPKAVQRVLNAIKLAGKLPAKSEYQKDLVHASQVWADKLFEANGAFIAFRRAFFMGERKDRREEMKRKGWTPEDAAVKITLNETQKRLKAFSNLASYPAFLHPFVKYQASWQYRLQKGLRTGERGVVNLVTVLFKEGLKDHPRSLEQTIQEYRPVSKSDAAFKQETLRYFNGDLWKTFMRLVKKPQSWNARKRR